MKQLFFLIALVFLADSVFGSMATGLVFPDSVVAEPGQGISGYFTVSLKETVVNPVPLSFFPQSFKLFLVTESNEEVLVFGDFYYGYQTAYPLRAYRFNYDRIAFSFSKAGIGDGWHFVGFRLKNFTGNGQLYSVEDFWGQVEVFFRPDVVAGNFGGVSFPGGVVAEPGQDIQGYIPRQDFAEKDNNKPECWDRQPGDKTYEFVWNNVIVWRQTVKVFLRGYRYDQGWCYWAYPQADFSISKNQTKAGSVLLEYKVNGVSKAGIEVFFKTKPVTLHDYDGLWHNTPFYVNFSSFSESSGIKFTSFNFAGVERAGSTAFIDLDGNNELTFYSVDDNGVVEEPKKIFVALDSNAPLIDLNAGGGAWSNSNIEVGFRAWDGLSGLKSFRYFLNGSWFDVFGDVNFVLGDGNHLLQVEAVDKAGNRAFVSRNVLVDSTKPVIDLNVLAGWSRNALLGVSVFDAVSRVSVFYRVNQGSWLPFSGGLNLVDGVHLIEFKAVDEAGNETDANTVVRIDSSKPVIVSNLVNEQSIKAREFLLNGVVFDAFSGLESFSIKLNGRDINVSLVDGNYSALLLFSDSNVYLLSVKARDFAGNEIVADFNLFVDFTAPSVNALVSVDKQAKKALIDFNAFDDFKLNEARVFFDGNAFDLNFSNACNLNNGFECSFSRDFNASEVSLLIQAIDWLGNVSEFSELINFVVEQIESNVNSLTQNSTNSLPSPSTPSISSSSSSGSSSGSSFGGISSYKKPVKTEEGSPKDALEGEVEVVRPVDENVLKDLNSPGVEGIMAYALGEAVDVNQGIEAMPVGFVSLNSFDFFEFAGLVLKKTINGIEWVGGVTLFTGRELTLLIVSGVGSAFAFVDRFIALT